MPNLLPFSNQYTEEELLNRLCNDYTLAGREDIAVSLPMDYARLRDAYARVELEQLSYDATGSRNDYNGSKQYDKCDICYDFSMLFGGSHKGRDIENEEQFEIVKEEFVTHFNKCHKDIMEKRPEYKEKRFKKVEESNIGGVFHCTL